MIYIQLIYNREEFINGYIRLEETIKAKRNKFQKVLEEFEDNTKKYNDNLNRHLNEYPIGNDLTNESTLYVSVYEAKDLDGGIITSCNPFVTLTFEGKTVQTNLKKNTSKPTWNEEFKFNVTNPDSELIIEVYNQVMIGSTKLGMRKFPLRDFLTQEKQISWYELQDTNNNNLPGQLNLKLQFIKSFNKYYKDRIANTERNYSIISKTHQKLERYCDEIENRPFGAIYLGEVDKLLDSDEMKNCEAIIREIDEQRQLLYVIHPNEDSTGGVLKVIPKKIISWGKSTKVLMMLYLICAIVALFARSDFVNFFISIATWVLLIYDKKFSAQKYFQNLIIVIGVSLGYDLIWVFMKWNEFWKGKNGDIEIGLKKAVYIISIIEMIVKGFLIPKLLAVKKKKETQ